MPGTPIKRNLRAKLTSINGSYTPQLFWTNTIPIVTIDKIIESRIKKFVIPKKAPSRLTPVLNSSSSITSLGEKIRKFLDGKDIEFKVELLDFDLCSEIQKKVLLAEYQIPRGWVSTYKRIAYHIGM